MKVTFYGQSCHTAEIAGKSLLFDPFIRQNELARDMDVSAVRADDLPVAQRRPDPVADALERAGRAGAPVTVGGTVRASSHDF